MEFISDNIKNDTRLALAGGVFSNVKINQKISELKNIKDIFIYPNMGMEDWLLVVRYYHIIKEKFIARTHLQCF